MLIYFPKAELVLAYCEECESLAPVKVSKFHHGSAIHLPKKK